MKELYFFDETFYWLRSGRRATVIEAECELTQSVRPDELRAAVVSALRVYRNFRARPVIVDRRFLVEDSEAEQVAVVSEADGLPRHLGTKETGGLMLYVSYSERRFTLHVFHGLADMRSICGFLGTVLRFYCQVGGDSLPAADSMDTFPCHEHILGEAHRERLRVSSSPRSTTSSICPKGCSARGPRGSTSLTSTCHWPRCWPSPARAAVRWCRP